MNIRRYHRLKNGLQKYFPIIRTRAEVLMEIQNQPKLSHVFQAWKAEYQEQFLDYVTGAKGVKILYDSFFKEIMNPETTPERLERFLSLILDQEVRVRCILPTDNSRISDENALLIMDILIELEDGSLANIEVQKVRYKFPGQRCACYSADLLLRQYKRVKGKKGIPSATRISKRSIPLFFLKKAAGNSISTLMIICTGYGRNPIPASSWNYYRNIS